MTSGRIEPGQSQYSLFCNETGGVVDDLIVYLVSDDDVFVVPNAANTAAVVGGIASAAFSATGEIEVVDHHRDYGVLAVQGPRSAQVLERLGLPTRPCVHDVC